ncbi:UNVERIFIED_CONTAM: hypothetical protein Sradi_5417900 [Sesamum radiatum]|uniref:Uncharacterized protein n=1 Tax=Sesamum radiatum TaxID=300843 RepID=A0AAW2LAE3_SESRA
MADLQRRSISSNTSTDEISPTLLGAIQLIVSVATREQVAAIAPTRVATPSDMDILEEEVEEGAPIPAHPAAARRGLPQPAQ